MNRRLGLMSISQTGPQAHASGFVAGRASHKKGGVNVFNVGYADLWMGGDLESNSFSGAATCKSSCFLF